MSSAAASRSVGSVSGGSLPDEPLELCPRAADRLDVRVLAGQQVLGGGEVGQLERRQLGVAVRDVPLQVLLQLAAAAEASRDLVVAQLLMAPEVECARVASCAHRPPGRGPPRPLPGPRRGREAGSLTKPTTAAASPTTASTAAAIAKVRQRGSGITIS